MQFTMRVFWRCFYWTAFAFSFLLVPFVMHYEVSGEFEKELRLKAAMWRVFWTYARYAIIGLVALIFLYFHGTFDEAQGGFSVRGFVMAMGSAFGLLQIIVFLGYGLVNVPR